jgi:hypothetical protein
MENGSHQAGVESPMVTREESEKNTEAARESVRKFKRGVCSLLRAVGFALAIHSVDVDTFNGNVDKIRDDWQDAADNLDGAEKECGEGEGPSPVGPVGADDPGTPLPRLSNAPTNSVPPLKIPRFNGLPRGR